MDFKITYQGKFMTRDGDLAVTEGDDYILRTIGLRLRTPKTCTLWPGAGLTRYSGMPVTSENIQALKRDISDVLTRDGFVTSPSIEVVVDKDKVDCALFISAQGLTSTNIMSITSGLVAPIPENEDEMEGYSVTASGTTSTTSNKYLRRNKA